jgi:DNA-binding transcriptional LysR family regulator
MEAQPAVSKMMRTLEKQLGAQLIQRSPRGIELTPAGQVLLGQAYEIIQSLDRAIDLVRQAESGHKSLSVGLVSGHVAASELTSEIILDFSRLCPNIKISVRELDFANQYTALKDGHVDVVIGRSPLGDDAFQKTALFAEPRVLAMRADHRLATASDLTAEDVIEETMVGMGDAPRPWTSFWHLDDIRNGAAKTDLSVRSLTELQFALMSSKELVMPIALSGWRMSTSHPGLRALRITDAPLSTAGSLIRANEDREHVLAFNTHAQTISQHLVDKVPEATLPEDVAGLRPATAVSRHSRRAKELERVMTPASQIL